MHSGGYTPDKSVFTHLVGTIVPDKRCRFNSLRSHQFSQCKLFWAKWKPEKNAAPGDVFGGCYFDADES